MPNAAVEQHSPSKRAAALYKEAQVLAEASIAHFVATLENAIQQASEIADGGDLYPTGIRDICRKLGETATYRVQSINSIIRHDGRCVADLHSASLHEDDLALELAQTEAQVPQPVAAPRAVDASAPFPSRVNANEPARQRGAFAPAAIIAEQLAAFGRRDQAVPGEFGRQQA